MEDQRDGWSGDTGQHWVEHQGRYDAMLAGLTPHLLEAAKIKVTDDVLDLGCGCGQTSRIAAGRASGGTVLGVDVSAPMLAEANVLAEREGLLNVRFEQDDAQTHTFPEAGFDVALSRFGVMFFDDPQAAFANIAGALRPGGRLVFLCWQDVAAQEYLIVPFGALVAFAPPPELGRPGVPGPFSLADPEHIRELLRQSGFDGIEIEPVIEPVRVGDDLGDVITYLRDHPVARSMFDTMDDETTAAALQALQEALRPYESAHGVILSSAAWLVTAQAGAGVGGPPQATI